MRSIACRLDPGWLPKVVAALDYEGFAVVADVLSPSFVQRLLDAVETVVQAVEADVGVTKLQAARQHGYSEWRLPMYYDPLFLDLLTVPELLQIVDAALAPTAVLRYQNLQIVPPRSPDDPPLRQSTFHQNTRG